MSTGAWLRYRDRPVAPRERRAAIRAVTLLLAAAASALLLTHPARRDGRSRPGSPAGAPHATALGPPVLSALERRTAEGFLASYLSYVYGRGPASRVKDTTAGLARSLQAQPVRVPPGLTVLEPRLLRLAAAAAPAGQLGVTAIISDEPPIDYRLELLLTPARDGLLVNEVDGR